MTTLKLGGPARRLVEIETEADALAAVVDCAREKLLVLGGGSNVVIADEGFEGTVLHMATRGIDVAREARSDGRVLVTAQAGEPWDDFVSEMVARNLSGIECLAGIPGLVGAVPMQNVGAYGQDVAETIERVRTWDRDLGRVVTFSNADCHFAYRSSVFRGRDRHVILDVTFALHAVHVDGASRPLHYAELTRALGIGEGQSAPLSRVREIVIELRRKKGMVVDPHDPDTRSAGSFFTNPILDAPALDALRTRIDPLLMPTYPVADGRTKVSAAWLIEHAGFKKGWGRGPVAISRKHALALTNRGGATTHELLALAREVRDGVHSRFGVLLEHEPVLVGVALEHVYQPSRAN